MEYREIPKLGVKTSLLGFGCMRFPLKPDGSINENSVKKLLDAAYKAGVNYFDTAYNYLGGQSEVVVGRILDRYPRDSYYLATKLPNWKCNEPGDAERIFEEQLQKLHKDYVDFYLLHSVGRESFDKLAGLGVIEYCEKLKAEGRIRNFGFSFHDDYAAFEHIINYRDWDFCQIQYNYMDTETQAGIRGYNLAAQKNVPLVVMEPLKGGTLSKLPPQMRETLVAVVPERSPSSWSLRWLAAQENIKVILSGMTYPWQLKDNLETMNSIGEFTVAEKTTVEDVRDAIRARVRNGCTGCSYCMPCPQGVDIPGNFRRWNEEAMYKNTGAGKNWHFSIGPSGEGGPEKCIACGKCEKICPQHLHIIENLKTIRAENEKNRG